VVTPSNKHSTSIANCLTSLNFLVSFSVIGREVVIVQLANTIGKKSAKRCFIFLLYFLVLLCKGSVLMLGGQEMCWFLLVLLGVKRLPKGLDGMVVVVKLVANK
jgi:hypothetical protein